MKELLLTKKSVWGTAVLALIFFGNGGKTTARPVYFRKPEISYIGSNQEFLQFAVNFKNDLEESFLFEIYDDAQKVVYRKKFAGNELNKKIYLYKDVDYKNVTFRIKCGNKQFRETINVKQNNSTG